MQKQRCLEQYNWKLSSLMKSDGSHMEVVLR